MSENASHACQRGQLQKFSKDVIIEAFLRVTFSRLDDVVEECKIIQYDKRFKSLMEKSEELRKQVLTMLNNNENEKMNIAEYIEWMNRLSHLNNKQNIIQNKIDKLLEI